MKKNHAVRSYDEWEAVRKSGRGGKKKVRRDTTLTKREDGTLVFTYGQSELLALLTPDGTYTLSMDNNRYYPTYSNIFLLIAKVSIYNDSSHYKHYAQTVRVYLGGERYAHNEDGKWVRVKATIPFVNGLQFRDGKCINPEIAVDYKRVLNRAMSLPLLRKTETLAKVLRVATRMQIMVRESGRRAVEEFDAINLDDTTAEDAQIVINNGNAMGLWKSWLSPEEKHKALMRCAENGLADYREWLYKKHGCYEMVPIYHTYENPEGEKQ